MTLTIAWWVWPTVITLGVLAAANWWPDPDTGVSAAVGAALRLLAAILGLGVMWAVLMIWRLNS